MFRAATVAFAGLLAGSTALADGHGHGHGHKHGHHRHHHHDHYVEVERVYYPERVVQYVPAPQPAPRQQVTTSVPPKVWSAARWAAWPVMK
ncbi:hypothetical protein [Methylomonas koyamae]|uniref:hypothetical protein n=1 Tax=Methylomonas koyamae TaxID=702114 RepID=UPI000A67FC39|nr:hypothetical protein [Methylomonas koyamae]